MTIMILMNMMKKNLEKDQQITQKRMLKEQGPGPRKIPTDEGLSEEMKMSKT